MKIAIPSYKRYETIQKKTLRVLQEYNFDPSMIEIFVNDQEPGEYDRYKEALSKNEFAKHIPIIAGVPTIGEQRNFIERYYPEGIKLMMLDDDIMFGQITDHDPALKRVTNHGEDYEYSLRQYTKHGVVARLDWITVKSKYYGEEGGLQTVRTEQYIHDSISKIAEMFPDLCTMYIRKTTGHAELKLRDTSGGKYDKQSASLESFF